MASNQIESLRGLEFLGFSGQVVSVNYFEEAVSVDCGNLHKVRNMKRTYLE